MTIAGYKNLFVWQKAHRCAIEIYRSTKNFPQEELYGITSQLRRSSLSVPTNIVEGYARGGKNELRRFITIALGSLAESEYLLDFSRDIGYLSNEQHKYLQELRHETGNYLWKFYKSL